MRRALAIIAIAAAASVVLALSAAALWVRVQMTRMAIGMLFLIALAMG